MKLNALEFAVLIAIIIFSALVVAGCAHNQSPADTRKCCERVSAHGLEMDTFNRYCKVALFLAQSENKKEVGSGVRKKARDAVNICKFVFNVETDDELVVAGDQQDYYKVRSYLAPDPFENGGWNHPDCDPSEMGCEEF